MPNKSDAVVFAIIFRKGRAARNRLPLSHVIATLKEFDLMIRDVGKRIQRNRGITDPTGDFGIELLTGPRGIAFLKGSVTAMAAPTRDVDNAAAAFIEVMHTTVRLGKKKAAVSVDEYGAPIVRRLATITALQEKDETELGLEMKQRGKPRQRATLTTAAMEAVKKLTAAEFQIEGTTLYGKLKGLTDRSRTEQQDDIWGELVEEGGTIWRIKFKPDDLDDARKLFTRQVVATGNAFYFKANTPRLDVDAIREELPRDYLKAFERFSSDYGDIFGDRDPRDIINEIRG